MGIFDIFKTKVNEAAEKAKKKGGTPDDPSARTPAEPPANAEAGTQAASDMVSEGAPVSASGEAAPGVGDDGAPADASGSGMTQSIKDNVAKGADKAGEMAEGATGNRYDDKIDSAVQQTKDKMG